MKLTKVYLLSIGLLLLGLLQISPAFTASNKEMQPTAPTDTGSTPPVSKEGATPSPREGSQKNDQMLKDKNNKIRHNRPPNIIKDELPDCEDSNSRDSSKDVKECEKPKNTMEYVK